MGRKESNQTNKTLDRRNKYYLVSLELKAQVSYQILDHNATVWRFMAEFAQLCLQIPLTAIFIAVEKDMSDIYQSFSKNGYNYKNILSLTQIYEFL